MLATAAFADDQSAPPSSSAPSAAPSPVYFRAPIVPLPLVTSAAPQSQSPVAPSPLVTGSVPPSQSPVANEFDVLAPPYRPLTRLMDWGGFYVGGQFSYSDASADFTNSTQTPIAYSLRELVLESEFAPSNWPLLGAASHGAVGYGGFVGYNFPYAQVVFGLEANYDQASLSVVAPNTPIARLVGPASNGDTYLVNITGTGSVTDLNFGTLRARAGWNFGNFLPYVFGGLAIGQANVNISETTSGQQNPPAVGPCSGASTPPCTPFSFTGTAGRNSEWLYGAAGGVGLDVAVTRRIFLRAEYEYVHFTPVATVPIDINTIRVGAGIRF
jgi:outer membrane immunogenic protein